jgi:hypothetical protein
MFYFKFVYNFVYISFVFLKMKLDNNDDNFLDFELDINKLYIDMNIDDDYYNIIGFEYFLDCLDFFSL